MGLYIGPTEEEGGGIASSDDTQIDIASFSSGAVVCAYSPTMSQVRGNFGASTETDSDDPWDASVGCVDWRKSQWSAEFKGVPFIVESDTRTGGRRIQVHEYPSREYWDNEDLGRLRQQIDVQGFVFGDRSDLWSEKLFAACSSPGPAKLFLPMRPPLTCVCLSVEPSFRADQMGRMNFNMTFSIETNLPPGQLHQKHITQVQLQSETLKASNSVTAFSRTIYEWLSQGTPQVAHSTTAEFIREVGRSLRTAAKAARLTNDANSEIEHVVNRMLTEAPELATVSRSVANTMTRTAATSAQRPPGINYFPVFGAGVGMRSSTGEVLPQPGGKDEGFGGLFEKVMRVMAEGAKKNPGDLAQALIPLTNFAPTILRTTVAASGVTASIQAELKMVEALSSYVRRVSLVNSINAGIKVAPERQPDASLTRTRLLEQIDDEIALAVNDHDVRENLRKLRATVVKYVNHFSIGGTAAVELPDAWGGKPLAVVAANAYVHTDVTNRDAELMRFNGVTHPLFPVGRIDALYDRSMRYISDTK